MRRFLLFLFLTSVYSQAVVASTAYEQGKVLGAYAAAVDLMEEISRSPCGYAIKKRYSLDQSLKEVESQTGPQQAAIREYLKTPDFKAELKRLRQKNREFVSEYIRKLQQDGIDQKTLCGMLIGFSISSFQTASQEWQQFLRAATPSTVAKTATSKPPISYDCTLGGKSEEVGFARFGSQRNGTTRDLVMRIHNNSSAVLNSFTVRVVIYDCASSQFVEDQCVRLGEASAKYINNPELAWITGRYVEIPTGQARDIRTTIWFEHNLDIRGHEFYSCTMLLDS